MQTQLKNWGLKSELERRGRGSEKEKRQSKEKVKSSSGGVPQGKLVWWSTEEGGDRGRKRKIAFKPLQKRQKKGKTKSGSMVQIAQKID